MLRRFIDGVVNDALDIYAASNPEKMQDINCFEVISFDFCKAWALEMQKKYLSGIVLLISVSENTVSKKPNDKLKIFLALLDSNKKPMPADEKNAVSGVYYAGTIDQKLIDLLNGEETVICKMKTEG